MEEYNAKKYADLAEQLQDKIADFLLHHTQYPTDVEVGICDETQTIILESPSKIPAEYHRFSIADFIMINEKGLYEPDKKVIFG